MMLLNVDYTVWYHTVITVNFNLMLPYYVHKRNVI